MVDDPTFLVGAEQSGSTLLRSMLDSHPEIAFAEEFDYVIDAIGVDGSFPETSEFQGLMRSKRSFAASEFTIDEDLSFPELAKGFLACRQQEKGATVVGATVHYGFSQVLWLWPNAKFIHLVRDPRDVAPARVSQGLAGNVWHGLDRWIQAENEWAALSGKIRTEQALTVRFSDLIVDHHSALTKICRFLGVDYTSQMLNHALDTDYRGPSALPAGRWRHSMDQRDVQLVEARVGNRLTELGFEPSGLPPLELDEQERLNLGRHNGFGRTLRRMGSFGVRLTVADLMAKALGKTDLQDSLRAQMNEREWEARKMSWSEGENNRASR